MNKCKPIGNPGTNRPKSMFQLSGAHYKCKPISKKKDMSQSVGEINNSAAEVRNSRSLPGAGSLNPAERGLFLEAPRTVDAGGCLIRAIKILLLRALALGHPFFSVSGTGVEVHQRYQFSGLRLWGLRG